MLHVHYAFLLVLFQLLLDFLMFTAFFHFLEERQKYAERSSHSHTGAVVKRQESPNSVPKCVITGACRM